MFKLSGVIKHTVTGSLALNKTISSFLINLKFMKVTLKALETKEATTLMSARLVAKGEGISRYK